MKYRLGLACAVISVALASLGEQAFFALVEWPAWGRPSSDLVFITTGGVLRPWHVLTMLTGVSVGAATVGVQTARRYPAIGGAVTVSSLTLTAWWAAMATQRPRVWSIALVDAGPTGGDPPWANTELLALVGAAFFLIAALACLIPLDARTRPVVRDVRLSAAVAALSLLVIVLALCGGKALPWWTVPTAIAAALVGASRAWPSTNRAMSAGLFAAALLAGAIAIGSLSRHDANAALATGAMAVVALVVSALRFRRHRRPSPRH